MNRETRTFSDLNIETRADGTTILRGYPIVFNSLSENLGGFREVVSPEAVKRALAEDDVRGLFNHDPNQVLGRTSAGTMRLRSTKRGVEMEIDLPNTEVGRTVAEGIRRGDISGGSFGFRVLADKWADKGSEDEEGRDLPLRTLTDVRLYDVGPVTFPAYPDTSMAMRSMEAWTAAKPTGDGVPPPPVPTPDPAAEAARKRDLDLLEANI